MTAPTASSEVEHRVRRSPTLGWAVRAGLVAYGLLHLLVAWIAVRLVLTPEHGTVTGRGALAQLAGDTAGRLVLFVLAAGFFALVVWQVIAAAVGYAQHGRLRRTVERLAALCRGAVWGYLAMTTTALAVSGGSGGSPGQTTATVMGWPAGVLLVAVTGLVVAGVGVGLGVFGWRTGFLDQLDSGARLRERRRTSIVTLGRVGYVTKGLALVLIGVLLVWAAWTHDPHKSGGLDQALLELVGGGIGKAAIIAVAAGLACFGLFLVARAWHLNRDALTS